MAKIDYQTVTVIKVKVDGKLSGEIREVTGGWAYFPRGTGGSCGETFTSQFAVMRSLEAD